MCTTRSLRTSDPSMSMHRIRGLVEGGNYDGKTPFRFLLTDRDKYHDYQRVGTLKRGLDIVVQAKTAEILATSGTRHPLVKIENCLKKTLDFRSSNSIRLATNTTSCNYIHEGHPRNVHRTIPAIHELLTQNALYTVPDSTRRERTLRVCVVYLLLRSCFKNSWRCFLRSLSEPCLKRRVNKVPYLAL